MAKTEKEKEYQIGDTIFFEEKMVIPGFISGGSKSLLFTMALVKNISEDVTAVEVSTTAFNIRVENKYLITNEYSENSNIADYFTVALRGNNYIAFGYISDTAFSVTNNVPVNMEVQ